jgi:CRISPR-associated protein Cmr3
MATYLIKLYPIDRYYFGSDITFGSDNENYFVRSAYFPQQTTLLGMLRYYLLVQNNFLEPKGKVKLSKEQYAPDLIGPAGFNAQSKTTSNFGIIKKIYPVFITGPDGEYFVQSREYGLQWHEDEVTGIKKQEIFPLKLQKRKGLNSFSGSSEKLCYFEGFNSKTEIPDLLVNASSGQMRYFDFKNDRKLDPMNGIFVANEQVGIRIPPRDKQADLDKGFYRQVGFTMLSGYCFAFYADIEKKTYNFKSGLVRMGADQSWFRIEIKEKTEEDTTIKDFPTIYENLFHKVNNFSEKVVLLSDCIIQTTDYNNIPFASIATAQFQYLKIVPVTETGAYKLNGAGIGFDKSEFKTLVKKGSVLYVNSKEQKNKLIHDLKLNEPFYQIGYNYAI